MAAYGGLAGGALGGAAWLRAKKLDAWSMLDACAPSLALGIVCARIGCFLAGCDYGAPTTSFVGTSFPAWSHAFRDHLARGLVDADAPGSLPVHPTELYEAAAGLVLFYVVRGVAERTSRAGVPFVALVVGYGALRSIIELFRGDASRGHLGPLSTAQVFAIVTSGVVLALFVRRSHVVASASSTQEVA
jgi:phosphatidylglycerol:prolipoprotein diacylglycerol transferase